MILLVDNYDSFTYNLVAPVRGARRRGRRAPERRGRRRRGGGDGALASGRLARPRAAEQSGATLEIVEPPARRRRRRSASASATRRSSRRSAARSGRPAGSCTARRASVHHDGAGLFDGLPQDFHGGALPLARGDACAGVPDVSATSDDGEVMAVRHRELPVDGVQFHPGVRAHAASDATCCGNFLERMIQAALTGCSTGTTSRRDEAREAMGEIMRGEATPAQIGGFLVALRAEGRDRGRDRRLRGGDARPRAVRSPRSATTSSTRPERAATAHGRSTSRPPRRSSRPPRAPASRSTATAPSRRRPARRTCSRRSASSSSCRQSGSPGRSTSSASASCSRRPTTRRCATLRPCGGARDADGLQRARPADEPCRRPRADRRRLRARARPDDRGGARAARRRRAFVVHGAGGIDELSPAGPNLVCEVVGRRGARADDRPARARDPALRARRAARRLARRECGGDPSRVRRRGARRPARGDPAQRSGRDRRRRPRGDLREGLELARGGRLGRGRDASTGSSRSPRGRCPHERQPHCDGRRKSAIGTDRAHFGIVVGGADDAPPYRVANAATGSASEARLMGRFATRWPRPG